MAKKPTLQRSLDRFVSGVRRGALRFQRELREYYSSEALAKSRQAWNSAKRNADIDILKRDATIKKYKRLRGIKMAAQLDLELAQQDDIPVGFPRSWEKRFYVKIYVEAYKHEKCRPLFHRLVSHAKNTPILIV